MHELVCKLCGSMFLSKKSYRKFCSEQHYHDWSRGRINKTEKTIEHRNKLSNSLKGRILGLRSKERDQKISSSRKGMTFSLEHRRKLSDAKVRQAFLGTFGGRQAKFVTKSGDIFHAHSNFELRRMQFLDSCVDVKFWSKKHGIVIEYELDGVVRRYVPDFLVEYKDGVQQLQEVKGFIYNKEMHDAKVKAAINHCFKSGISYRLIFKDQLEKL